MSPSGDLVLGLDMGTSGVKAIAVDEDERVLAEAATPLTVEAPRPGWSEQRPEAWSEAACACLDRLAAEHGLMARVAAMGLSGQMLGAVLVGRDDRAVRPAILWNDQRATAECAVLRGRVPDIGRRANGTPDPGLTAPKLMWLAAHEPGALARADCLMLPKDHLRLWLTGERATDPSDAGGTMMLDCASGRWDPELVAAAGWEEARLPPVVPSRSVAGRLRPALAARWGLRAGLPVAAGAGDNMACALGAGAARPGEAAITLGTSGVICAVDGAFRPGPEAAILTSAHAAPGAFLSMAVVMSATASLAWLAGLTGTDPATLAAEAERVAPDDAPLCRPSLTGLRTPHDRPEAGGAIAGLTPRTGRAALARAVMEGVAFQLRECAEAQRGLGIDPGRHVAVGGGARSPFWLRLVAEALGRPILTAPRGDLAAPMGAARLARAALRPGEAMAVPPPEGAEVRPDPARVEAMAARFDRWREALAPG